MDTLTAPDHPATLHGEPSLARRHSFGATLVAGLYFALLVCSPLIVRYAPDPDHAVVTAAQGSDVLADPPRCAVAPEFGRSCDLAAR